MDRCSSRQVVVLDPLTHLVASWHHLDRTRFLRCSVAQNNLRWPRPVVIPRTIRRLLGRNRLLLGQSRRTPHQKRQEGLGYLVTMGLASIKRRLHYLRHDHPGWYGWKDLRLG